MKKQLCQFCMNKVNPQVLRDIYDSCKECEPTTCGGTKYVRPVFTRSDQNAC